MNKDELIEFLRTHLRVQVDCHETYIEDEHVVKVTLLIGDETICESESSIFVD